MTTQSYSAFVDVTGPSQHTEGALDYINTTTYAMGK